MIYCPQLRHYGIEFYVIFFRNTKSQRIEIDKDRTQDKAYQPHTMI